MSSVGIITNVVPSLQNKQITITENTTTSITPDIGYNGLGKVDVTTNVSSGGDLSEYFDTTISKSESSYPGWYYLIKKLPNDTISVTTPNISYGFLNFPLPEVPFINTSNVVNMEYLFTNSEKLITIPLIDTSNVKYMGRMFNNCSNFETMPSLNTSNVTDMNHMFNNCTKLKNVPVLNTSKVTNFYEMFVGCNQLTDTSLDNILQMCINATSYSSTKTLRQIGFYSTSTYPVSRIGALPHYQDFINAGWTIGY